MRRVVVTGLGLVTPLGDGVEANWRRLIAGESGIRAIDRFDVADLPSRVAGMVPAKDAPDGFDIGRYLPPKEQRKISLFIIYAVAAAAQAVRDAGLDGALPDAERARIGVQVGSGIGGLPEIYDTSVTLHEKGPRRVSPFFIPSALINLASGNISIRHGFKGPNHSAVTACATGAHAIGDAGRMIALGDADAMVAGGAEAALGRLAIAGFAASRALTHNFNDTPEQASRPWDRDRDGFTIAEGAGVVVLEERERALARGATIYAELAGYGMSGDAYHITAPAPDGDGGFRAMRAALASARLGVGDIDYINAHGTSTPLGDEIELGAVKRLFGEHAYRLSMSSTKSAIGHLLGAAGAVEAIYTILALRHGVLPPTRNLDNPSEGCDLDLVPHEAKRREIRAALSNAFGFGGTNSSLIFTPAES
jgi:3-oxoacyl-[acyl-carrier-protein] synthase II